MLRRAKPEEYDETRLARSPRNRRRASLSPDPDRAPTSITDVAAYYSYWWENQRDIRKPVFDRLTEKVSRILGLLHFETAADLGAGKGAIVAHLRRHAASVTAVEFNPDFAEILRLRFPGVDVICEDLRFWLPSGHYDVVTCIEVAQVLHRNDLLALLQKLREHAGRILVSISNANSFHGRWVRVRRFQAPFIVEYTPKALLNVLRDAGYVVISKTGVGFLTPVSLFKGFRGVVVSRRWAERLHSLDEVFPGLCHLYLVEAVPARTG
jgi:2-polyprenyl-3-methyl-5-hydroxy-6-metoxy-1,4-benzoquinol methylase